jgi:predicted 2-oxoglutarate/Fe(II)-dependent dioxygenase YbiX
VGGDIIVGRGNNKRSLPQPIGRTIYYNTAVDHGVVEVTKGKRLVLVTWFRKGVWQS